MNPILKLIAYLHRAFASRLSANIAWALIAVLGSLLVIESADRLF